MSLAGGTPGFQAMLALVDARTMFPGLADKDWATATGLIVKKLLTSAGQTTESLLALRAAVGADIFDTQLKTLSHHQAKLLARRLDKTVPDLEVSTARAAIGHILTLLTQATNVDAAPVADPVPDEPATTEFVAPEPEYAPEAIPPETTSTDDPPPSPPGAPNPYFGRKSFRTG